MAYSNFTLPDALRLNTEKARSELLIMPILMEARRQAHYRSACSLEPFYR